MPELSVIALKKSNMNLFFVRPTLLSIKQNFAKHTRSWVTATMEISADLLMEGMNLFKFLSISSYVRENAMDTGEKVFAIMELDVNLGTGARRARIN